MTLLFFANFSGILIVPAELNVPLNIGKESKISSQGYILFFHDNPFFFQPSFFFTSFPFYSLCIFLTVSIPCIVPCLHFFSVSSHWINSIVQVCVCVCACACNVFGVLTHFRDRPAKFNIQFKMSVEEV